MKNTKFASRGGACAVVSAFLLVGGAFAAAAATWTVYPTETDGMTGPQQVTNALTQLASGDTILVKPGTYDFTGISMRTDTYTNNGVTYVITNHCYRNIAFNIVGDASGHWDDEVVFTGNGRFCDLLDSYKTCNFSNITFDGFDCQRYPSGASHESRGGALRLDVATRNPHTASNCVFRNCSAYIGGAVNSGILVDCLCSNNYCSAGGGAGCNTRFYNSRVVNNRSDGNYGASYSHLGCFNTHFEGNSTKGSGGVTLHSKYVCSNCTFKANVAGNTGGALYVDNDSAEAIMDCTFTDNVATNGGGAIYITKKKFPKVSGCTFTGNNVPNSTRTTTDYGGGAIYCLISSDENAVSNCTFVGNWTLRNPGGAVINGSYEDCAFISNQVKTVTNGGASYHYITGGVRRCVFVENWVVTNGFGGACYSKNGDNYIVDCAFTNNYAWQYAGAVYNGACTNCIFSGNMAIYRGGAIALGEAVDCVFRDNRKGDRLHGITSAHYEYGGGCAYGASLVRCDSTDAAFWKCSLLDCVIHDVTNSPSLFYEENWATNCLITGGSKFGNGVFYRYLYRPGSASDYRGAVRGSMVNCTFAGNKSGTDNIFGCNGAHNTNDFDFVNCIFYNNKDRNGNLEDLSGEVYGVTLQNCLYGVSDGTLPWQDNGGNVVSSDPKFAKDYDGGRYPYYMPKPGSPAYDAGVLADWMSSATDLSGTNRVLNANVDIGCYESCIPFIGAVIIIR